MTVLVAFLAGAALLVGGWFAVTMPNGFPGMCAVALGLAGLGYAYERHQLNG